MKKAIALLIAVAATAAAQERTPLPAGLEPSTRTLIERLADSLRSEGLPPEPIYAKAAEGRLKQATDAQIVTAVRALATRFRQVRAGLGNVEIDPTTMGAAATALSAGVDISIIRDMRVAAGAGNGASADLASALVTVTDLVSQRVPVTAAVSAVQSLLVRRAPAEQYTRLRLGVTNDILSGRNPVDAARATAESIVKLLPPSPPIPLPVKPPLMW